MAELIPILKEQVANNISALLMFIGGGSDHNCKHLSVQTALFALILICGMDNMPVLRTAPQ